MPTPKNKSKYLAYLCVLGIFAIAFGMMLGTLFSKEQSSPNIVLESPSPPVVEEVPYFPEESTQTNHAQELEKEQALQEQRDIATAHYQSGAVPVILDAMWNGSAFIVFIDGQRQFNYTIFAQQTCVGVSNFVEQGKVIAVQVMDYEEMRTNKKLKNLGQALCR
jgi:hypothetical protein